MKRKPRSLKIFGMPLLGVHIKNGTKVVWSGPWVCTADMDSLNRIIKWLTEARDWLDHQSERGK